MAIGGLDATGLRILDEVQKDGGISIVELSRRVHLTKTPCAERLRRLGKAGVIRGYFAQLNAAVVDVGSARCRTARIGGDETAST